MTAASTPRRTAAPPAVQPDLSTSPPLVGRSGPVVIYRCPCPPL